MNVVPNSALPELSSQKSDATLADTVNPQSKTGDDSFSKYLEEPQPRKSETEVDSADLPKTVSTPIQSIDVVPIQGINFEAIVATGSPVATPEVDSQATELLSLVDTRIESTLDSGHLSGAETVLPSSQLQQAATDAPSPKSEIFQPLRSEVAAPQTNDNATAAEVGQTNDLAANAGYAIAGESGTAVNQLPNPNQTDQVASEVEAIGGKALRVADPAPIPSSENNVDPEQITAPTPSIDTPVEASEVELVEQSSNQDIASDLPQLTPRETTSQNVQTNPVVAATQNNQVESAIEEDRKIESPTIDSPESPSTTVSGNEFSNGESNENFGGTNQNASNSESAVVTASANELPTVNAQQSHSFTGALQEVAQQPSRVDGPVPVQEISAPTSQLKVAILANAASIENESSNTIQVDLHPAELGRLQIRIEQTGDQLHAKIIATEIASTELLMHDKQHLVEALDELGFGETSLDITHGGSGEQETEEDSQSLFPQNSSKSPSTETARLDQSVATQSSSSVGINFVA